MRILFFTLHWGYVRPYVSVIEELARRGHRIHLAADIEETFGNRPLVDRLVADHDNITIGWTPERPPSLLRSFKRHLRHGIAYLRYQESRFRQMTALKDAGAYRTPVTIRWLASRISRARLARLFRLLERALPLERGLVRYVREQAPDLVLVTPLLGISEDQFDELRAARHLGVRTAFCVAGWDNLSTMGSIRFRPDRVFVWNENQRGEAVEMHGYPGDRVVVTGAQSFDKWFARQPERSRSEFCARVGLPDRAYALYLCSAILPGSPSEAELVLEWCNALRNSGEEVLADLPVLVRPHPQRMKQWDGIDIDELPNVALWGRNPIDDESQSDYYDSMFHSTAVMGLSSTAMLEAAALGKPVFTVQLERFRANQCEMPHFRYFFDVAGGLLYSTDDLQAHARQLAARLRACEVPDPRSARYTEAFVRPHGLDVRGTDVFVEEIEMLAALPSPAPARSGPGLVALRWSVVYPLVMISRLGEIAGPHVTTFRRRVRTVLRRVARLPERAGKAVLQFEKDRFPAAYLMVRTYPQLGDSIGARLRALFRWAAGWGSSARFDDALGTPVPGMVRRYGLLYPTIVVARIIGGVQRSSRRVRRAFQRYRHQRSKQGSVVGKRVQELRSRWRMALHRGRKRLRSRFGGLIRRLKRIVGA